MYVNADNIQEMALNCFRSNNELKEISEIVDSIIEGVRIRGDEALLDYTKKYDCSEITNLKITKEEIDIAFDMVDKQFIEIMKEAMENIRQFHQNQMQKSWLTSGNERIVLGQHITPIERVGIYVPGGLANYPSTVLMNAIPAKIAGVKSVVMVTPAGKNGMVNPSILAAAKLAGVDEIYKVGGAQAIAALAFGTETIKRVYKIVGPGNIFVATAKKKVYGQVAIDMIAGPSEICIIADKKANPKYIAADLLSQAEHDEMASVVLITSSEDLANEVMKEITIQTKELSRKEIINKAIQTYGIIFIVDELSQAVALANEIAPEHLELMVEKPFEVLCSIKNAGSIFLGDYAPEPLGDYFAGPNHTLPTNGTAKFSSPLGVEDFMKKSNVIYYDRKALSDVKDKIIIFAQKEGLTAHANSIKVRFCE